MRGPTLEHALDYAAHGWEILLLRGKLPAVPLRDGGHGVLDATTDAGYLTDHWRRGYNIGARVPAGVIVIDTDPRHGGEENLERLAGRLGPLPDTLTCFSGRGDGGRHRYYRHPGGHLTSRQLRVQAPGVDLKTNAGYVVLPPSLHPDSHRPYRWADPVTPIAGCPDWLAALLRPVMTAESTRPFTPRVVRDGSSIADWFTAATTWADVLGEAGWTEIRGGWRHPNATSPISATVRHDLLFVYSPNTQFEVTEPGDPHGYTRFRAWAVLRHAGDLTAAARAARELRDGQRVPA